VFDVLSCGSSPCLSEPLPARRVQPQRWERCATPARGPVRSGRGCRPARGARAYSGRGVSTTRWHWGTPGGAIPKTPVQKCFWTSYPLQPSVRYRGTLLVLAASGRVVSATQSLKPTMALLLELSLLPRCKLHPASASMPRDSTSFCASKSQQVTRYMRQPPSWG